MPLIKVSVVVPCFNEADRIAETVGAVKEYLRARLGSTSGFEIITVDDGSTDGTGRVLAELSQRESDLRLVSFPQNRGRGAALRAGIRESTGEYVIALDADLSYGVEHIGDMLDAFEKDRATDCVVVSAYMKGGRVQGVPRSRLFLSRLANWTLAQRFGGELSTVTCMVRGYRGDMVRSLPLREDGKTIHLEILRELRRRDAQIVEIPGRLVWTRPKSRACGKGTWPLLKAACEHLRFGLTGGKSR